MVGFFSSNFLVSADIMLPLVTVSLSYTNVRYDSQKSQKESSYLGHKKSILLQSPTIEQEGCRISKDFLIALPFRIAIPYHLYNWKTKPFQNTENKALI